ncbi:hypothetical protein [Hellea balneolensis]|uniref:hypothetical protein n=1 Tax=Hellea balneolensis TaxID=287478 RepID=UPI0004193246|nr:hypothetical protein [Hellea balneolensis]
MITLGQFVLNVSPSFSLSRGRRGKDIIFKDADHSVAWKIYIELATRISLEPLHDDEGVEEAALNSLHGLFQKMRGIIREGGPEAREAAKLGIFVMNRVMRPFLAKWHKITQDGPYDEKTKEQFRAELKELQKSMRGYSEALLELMGIDDGLKI